ncbi:MAG: hypothetical protein ACYC1C_00895 [Chloroflexota bacterium]
MDIGNRPGEAKRRDWVAGLVLVAIGVLLLVGQYVSNDAVGLAILPTLAVVFLAWGVAVRKEGLFVPGGILLGLGLGAILVDGTLGPLSEQAQGGVFLLAFALGWGVVTVFTALFGKRVHWWPLIPGGVIAAVGGAMLAGEMGMQALVVAGQAWPLALIVAGLYLLVWRRGLR